MIVVLLRWRQSCPAGHLEAASQRVSTEYIAGRRSEDGCGPSFYSGHFHVQFISLLDLQPGQKLQILSHFSDAVLEKSKDLGFDGAGYSNMLHGSSDHEVRSNSGSGRGTRNHLRKHNQIRQDDLGRMRVL